MMYLGRIMFEWGITIAVALWILLLTLQVDNSVMVYIKEEFQRQITITHVYAVCVLIFLSRIVSLLEDIRKNQQ
jgi:hypothetical protein